MKKYKLFFITILIVFGGNALIYFLSKLLVIDYNLIGSIWDTKIPVINEFVFIYQMWYPFEIICLYFIFKYSKENYIKIIVSLTLSLVIAYICFLIYPTTIDRPIVDSYTNLTTLFIYLTYLSDSPVNCLPSVHCIVCFIMIFDTINNSKLNKHFKITIYIINALIIMSTIFVKQHVLYDLLASFIITLSGYYLISNLKIFKNLKSKLMKYT